MIRYVIVEWPEVQELMSHKDFSDHACLITEDSWVDQYGYSSYFVDERWLKMIGKC